MSERKGEWGSFMEGVAFKLGLGVSGEKSVLGERLSRTPVVVSTCFRKGWLRQCRRAW